MYMEMQCKWCQKLFDIVDKPKNFMANHMRWCIENPSRQKYLDSLKSRNSVKLMNDARKKNGTTNQYVKAKLNGSFLIHPLKGKKHPNPFKKHNDESIKIIREKALASNHRRLRKNTVEYNGVILDSSWELALAKRLDECNIRWERPRPIKWTDINGIMHNYFPDFYLNDFDLYLDPKNPAAYQNQKCKIEILTRTYNNIIFLLTLQECEEFEIIKYKN